MTTDDGAYRLDISRRRLLRSATLAVASGAFVAAASSAPALADSKFSHAMAKYQPTPKGAARCDNCSQFKTPSACAVVASPISASAWCQLYAAKS